MANIVKIDISRIKQKIDNIAYQKSIPIARALAEDIVEQRKERFLDEFDEDDITQEILAGPDPDFGVSSVSGNLFSFLGFLDGSDPTGDLRDYFERIINLRSGFTYSKASKTFIFKMNIPNEDDISAVTELANYTDDGWGEGRSWAYSIERGIPGLSRYKYSTDGNKLGGNSRSGTGIQRRNIIHLGAVFRPRSYITRLIKILTK